MLQNASTDVEGNLRTIYDSSKLDQIKVGPLAIINKWFHCLSFIKDFFKCEEIFVPGWRHFFPEIGKIARNQVS